MGARCYTKWSRFSPSSEVAVTLWGNGEAAGKQLVIGMGGGAAPRTNDH